MSGGISTPSQSALRTAWSSKSTVKKWRWGNPTEFDESSDILDVPYGPPYSKIVPNLLNGNNGETCLQLNKAITKFRSRKYDLKRSTKKLYVLHYVNNIWLNEELRKYKEIGVNLLILVASSHHVFRLLVACVSP